MSVKVHVRSEDSQFRDGTVTIVADLAGSDGMNAQLKIQVKDEDLLSRDFCTADYIMERIHEFAQMFGPAPVIADMEEKLSSIKLEVEKMRSRAEEALKNHELEPNSWDAGYYYGRKVAYGYVLNRFIGPEL